MKKPINSLPFIFTLMTAFSSLSQAVVLDISPTFQTASLGDLVSVDVIISDFAADEALGDFDFDLSFDDGILNLDSVIFGTELGFSDQDFSDLGGGLVNVNELSFEFADDLLASQGDSLTLATLNFNAIGLGISDLLFDTVFALGDQFGQALDFSVNSAAVEVKGPIDVSEPASLGLIVLGLLGIGMSRRNSRS